MFTKLDWLGKKAVCRTVLCLLNKDNKYETEIAREIDLSATAVSNALNSLAKEGIVSVSKHGWVNLYSLNKDTLNKRLRCLGKGDK